MMSIFATSLEVTIDIYVIYHITEVVNNVVVEVVGVTKYFVNIT